ncbi:hypothetical protein B0O99DRAFT_631510 [Bisporella sp. PMI_857]|nr:hypothetical protein B0O99DRAFT_631510 [Bisporella sp. PMI_857]
MSEEESFNCSACSASFRRAEHLRRHLASHSSLRPYKCDFCESYFKRRDVLRKHLKRCSSRIDQGCLMPGRLLVGKKMKSCDQCARAKKACDSLAPCSTCTSKFLICTYERQPLSAHNRDRTDLTSLYTKGGMSGIDDDNASDIYSTDLTFMYVEPIDLDPDLQFSTKIEEGVFDSSKMGNQLSQASLSTGQASSIEVASPVTKETIDEQLFDFLLNFTRESGVRSVFNYKRRPSRQHSREPRDTDSWVRLTSFSDSMLSHQNPYDTRISLVSLIEYVEEPMFALTKAIWDSFRVSRIRFSQNILLSVQALKESDEQCLHFFRPSNLRKFLQLFWDEWYPHCPVIHRPTFNVLSTPVVLLIPMALMGACMSPDPQDVTTAKDWLEFGEEKVFSSAILSGEPVDSSQLDNEPPSLRVLQAAYIICILLNWEGTDIMKRRVRHQRFTALVSAAREIGISSANHFPRDCVNMRDFEWNNFILREEAIRTFTYVFLLDTAFVIFNNTPPRMVLHEMDIEMAISEACFMANNASDCYQYWQCCASEYPLLLAEAISVMMHESYKEHSLRFMFLSTLNLFALVAGLHTVVFQQRSLFTCLPTTLMPIRNALVRWHSVWPLRKDGTGETTPCERWEETGFIGQAEEFASLIKVRLDMLEMCSGTISSNISGQSQMLKPAAGRLDDTSMSLVTDLMLSLTVTGQ